MFATMIKTSSASAYEWILIIVVCSHVTITFLCFILLFLNTMDFVLYDFFFFFYLIYLFSLNVGELDF